MLIQISVPLNQICKTEYRQIRKSSFKTPIFQDQFSRAVECRATQQNKTLRVPPTVIQPEQETSVEQNDNKQLGGRGYFLFAGFPLGPFFNRPTKRYEIVKDTMWTFEQPQNLGFSSVTINVRMTVVRLQSGGLWVHAPIAPTEECLAMVKELGEVEHIVLGTFAIEHKVFVGPFARKFPQAEVWVAPRQWSWPINLPLPLLGISRANIIKEDVEFPWANEIDQQIFQPPLVGIGPYIEVAFFHKSSKTLIVTDAVVFIPKQPLDIVNPDLLLDAAKPNPFAPWSPIPQDSKSAREFGWSRMVLQTLFLGPENLFEKEPILRSFDQVSGKLLVSPVTRVLVFSKLPFSTRYWIDGICKWSFNKIISCHFAGPVRARPADLKKAFGFVYEETTSNPVLQFLGPKADQLPEGDMKVLNVLDGLLKNSGTLYENPEKSIIQS